MDLQWVHIIIGALSAVFGAAAGLTTGVWRVAHIEQNMRKDFSQEIAESANSLAQRIKELAGNFDETFRGLRQKINDVELETQKGFVAKPDFEDFRREYREDMRDLKHSIAGISRAK